MVLGPTGRNFAAGTRGGIAYVFDERGEFASRCLNPEMVELEKLENPEDINFLRTAIAAHHEYTDSAVARRILADWEACRTAFVKGVFAAGDAHRGQSLIVLAISEGREAARCVDRYLMGRTALPTKGPGDLPRI